MNLMTAVQISVRFLEEYLNTKITYSGKLDSI